MSAAGEIFRIGVSRCGFREGNKIGAAGENFEVLGSRIVDF